MGCALIMRLFLDACVLFPVATREILRCYADAGGFTPLWSGRVMEEWARAAGAKQNAETAARGDIALWRARFSGEIAGYEVLEAGIDLPDPADIHVAAAAVHGQADALLTFNIRDFPLREMRRLGVARLHPDEYFASRWRDDQGRLAEALSPLAQTAAAHGVGFRDFLKRASLPRLGKAWEGAARG